MHLQPGTGKEWGMNLCRGRMITGGRSAPYSSWNKVKGSFRNPRDFGRLKTEKDFSSFFYNVKLSTGSTSGDERVLTITNHTGVPKTIKHFTYLLKNDKRSLKKSQDFKVTANQEISLNLNYSEFESKDLMEIVVLKEKESGTILYQGATQSIDVTPEL